MQSASVVYLACPAAGGDASFPHVTVLTTEPMGTLYYFSEILGPLSRLPLTLKCTLLLLGACVTATNRNCRVKMVKVKAFPYLITSVGPRADPGVQAVSPQVTVSHPPGGRLPLLSARPAVSFPAAQHHCRLASTKLYCLVTEAHRCKQLARGC